MGKYFQSIIDETNACQGFTYRLELTLCFSYFFHDLYILCVLVFFYKKIVFRIIYLVYNYISISFDIT
jgi:hypothetical protein